MKAWNPSRPKLVSTDPARNDSQYALRVFVGYLLLATWVITMAHQVDQSPILLAQTPGARLEMVDKVRMVEFGGGRPTPCFRMQFNLVDEKGVVPISKPKDPLQSIEIMESGQVYHPFYVRFGEDTSAQAREDTERASRYAVLVIDISGSMLDKVGNQTKFEAAKSAAKAFLNGFQSKVDHIAVVPFESHDVVETIKRADFADNEYAVTQQIDRLPLPKPPNNTALYSATVTALDVLDEKKKEDTSRTVLLVVLTDGQNEIFPNRHDDPGLLDGPEGLLQVRKKADDSGIQILTIGFGDESIQRGRKGAVDTDSLRKIAWPNAKNFYSARDAQNLSKLFRVARERFVNQLHITFVTRWDHQEDLRGKEVQFQVRLTLDDGRRLESETLPFATPHFAAPPFEGALTKDEKVAFIKTVPKITDRDSTLTTLLQRLMIVIILGGTLAFFWFGLPRFVWPERYLQSALSNYRGIPTMPQPPQFSRPSVPQVPPLPQAPRMPQRPQAPPRPGPGKADPRSTVSESKVTINPARVAPPGSGSQSPTRPRRPRDETVVDSGGKGTQEEDPWNFESPDNPKSRK